MVHVCVLGENRQYSEDTLLKDVAKEVQASFSHEILLATVDGKLQELQEGERRYQSGVFDGG